MANRMSMYSTASTTTLLKAIYSTYLSSQPHQLDASTSVVVNACLSADQDDPTVDAALSARAWEHARRRAEDGCVMLGYASFIKA